MLAMPYSPPLRNQRGVGLIELMVTIVILMIGLLGLAALQARASMAEMESYQRANALALIRDMEDSLSAGRMLLNGADGFTTLSGSYVGEGDSFDGCFEADGITAKYTRAKMILCEWSMSLKGASERRGTNANVGAMIGARGCLIPINSPTLPAPLAEFFIVVVWQGLSPDTDPAANSPGALCAPTVNFGNGLRRSVSTRISIPNLTS
jgi:type IV pilus assembly protein PilV